MKFKKDGYYKPTPKKFRILGDTLGAGCAAVVIAITTMDLSNNERIVGTVFFTILGPLLKALTNFFVKDDQIVDPTSGQDID